MPDNHRQRVWRESGNAARLRHPYNRMQQGDGSLMFWGGIIWGRRTQLMPIQGMLRAPQYTENILQAIVAPFNQNFREGFKFMDDNSRVHRAGVINNFHNLE